MAILLTLKRDNGIVQPTKWYTNSKNWSSCIQKCQCPDSWSLEAKKKENLHSLQLRFYEHRTLVPNNSFCKSAPCLRSSGELVSPIRLDISKETSQSSCGQEASDQVETGRSTSVGISSNTRNWNRKRGNVLSFEALAGKILLTQLCEKAYFQDLVAAGKQYKIRPDGTTDGEQILLCVENTQVLWQLFQKAPLLDQSWPFIL